MTCSCRVEENPWMASARDPEARLWCITHKQRHSDCHTAAQPTKGDAYTPDLFGGAYRERGEGKTRAQQLDFARREMRDTGSNSLFDLEARS